jgi:acetyltransferase-like isoleucine patch superfamily enzyme
MIKILKNIFQAIDNSYNVLVLKLSNATWMSYPIIKGRIHLAGKGEIQFGSNVKINSSFRSNQVGLSFKTAISVASEARVIIGDNVGISNSLIYAWKSIIIEKDVLIGGGCQIFDTDFHSISYEARVHRGDNETKTREVIIREGSFIGASSIILKGVEIGARSIVAAGSVVSRSIPADEVWGGNPAMFIKRLSANNSLIVK